MARVGIAMNPQVMNFDPFPHLLGKYFVPYDMEMNNPQLRNYITQDEFEKLVFPFTYTTTFSFNPLNRAQFRYAYVVLLNRDFTIKKILRFD